MKQYIINLLKYNNFLYNLYFYTMSFLINIIKLFVRTDDKLILFNSYGGRKFDDSPKEIFDLMANDERFAQYNKIWAFHKPEQFKVNGAKKISIDRISYIITALKARVWITNSSVEKGLNFKKKNTIYINTWHGSPIKKMGSDISSNNKSFKSKGKAHFDIMNVQSDYEVDIFSKCFDIPYSKFLKVGLPRNDILSNYKKTDIDRIKFKLSIWNKKKVILYCPTYREYNNDGKFGVTLTPPMDLSKWEHELSDEYVLLFRAHYEVSKHMKIRDNGFVRDVTNYLSLNELMIVSDILISDYSSIFFDYSIMNKCMFHFTYDYQEYADKRGVYFDIRDYISGADDETKLMELIKNSNVEAEIDKTKKFRQKYVQYFGNAANLTVEYIAEHIL